MARVALQAWRVMGAAAMLVVLAGCSSYKPDGQVVGLVQADEFGRARERIAAGP